MTYYSLLFGRITIASKDGDAVVEKNQNNHQKKRHADWRATDAVDGVGLTGGEKGGDEWASVGGEELDEEEEEYREEQKSNWAQKIRYELCNGFPLISHQHRN